MLIRPLRPSLIVLACLTVLACGPAVGEEAALPDCEWCGTAEAPEGPSWRSRIAPEGEPGEAMVVTGTVFGEDGEPAAGVVIYAYQTDAEGIYRQEGDETGNGRRHGLLRGWVKTGEDGRYRFDTIRPASYPESTIPQHIHMTVLPPDGEERWIDSVEFTDDPLLTERHHRQARGRGGPGIVTPERDDSGTWHAERDILLAEI